MINKSPEKLIDNNKYYYYLIILLCLLGSLPVFFSIYQYGCGLSYDSVKYISVARNLLKGEGFKNFYGGYLKNQPPFYPVLLSAVSITFNITVISASKVVNLIVYFLIIFSSMILLKKFIKNRILIIVGIVYFILSIPLYRISIMAWTEPLFIMLSNFFIIFLIKYSRTSKISHLLYASTFAGLACITRYIGIYQIIAGIIVILLNSRKRSVQKMTGLFSHIAVSLLPLITWSLYNYFKYNYYFWKRPPAQIGFFENIRISFQVLVTWIFPWKPLHNEFIAVLTGLTIIILILYLLYVVIRKEQLKKTAPIILYALGYYSALIFSASQAYFQQINFRLLAPVYIPLAIIIFILIEKFMDHIKEKKKPVIINYIIIILILLPLFYPFSYIMKNTRSAYHNGAGGLNTRKYWESDIIRFLEQRNYFRQDDIIYSNGIPGVYLFGDLKSSLSLKKKDLPKSKGQWPPEPAYLIWFHFRMPKYFCEFDTIKKITSLTKLKTFKDGVICRIEKK